RRRAAHPGPRESDRRRAGLRLDPGRGLRRPLRSRRRARQGQGDVRGAAGTLDEHLRGRDGHPGLEITPLVVPDRRERRGDPARCRGDVREADEGDHRGGGIEPRGDGLPAAGGDRAHRDRGEVRPGSGLTCQPRGSMPDTTTTQITTNNDVIIGYDGKPRCAWGGAGNTPGGRYHDEVWGTRTFDESALFEALTLGVFQAGLSWS